MMNGAQPMDLTHQQSRRILPKGVDSSGNLSPAMAQHKTCDIRRSASSVSYKGNADVREHNVSFKPWIKLNF